MASPRLETNRPSTKLRKANPPLAIVYREIDHLQPDSKNPRVHSKKEADSESRA